jgi:putative DNA primase/helicase
MSSDLNPLDAADAAWTVQCGVKQSDSPPPAPPPDPLEIEVRAGERHLAADEGLKALYRASTPFFQRHGSIVRVCMTPAKTAGGEITFAPGITPVSHAMLGRELGRTARWVGFTKKGDERPIDPPKPVVEQIAAMAGEWDFPALTGVIGTPTLRPDGSLLLTEGYDPLTGLVLVGALKIPPVPDIPTRDDAEQALKFLDALLNEFPFADADKGDQSLHRSRPYVRLSMGRPVSQYAGNEGCAG